MGMGNDMSCSFGTHGLAPFNMNFIRAVNGNNFTLAYCCKEHGALFLQVKAYVDRYRYP